MNLEESINIIKLSEPIAKKYGMSIALGGSSVHSDAPPRDLDLIIFNLKTSIAPDHISFLNDFISLFDLDLWGAVDHSHLGDEKLVYKLKTKDKQRIDLLFVNLEFKDRKDGIKVLVRRLDYKK